MTTKQPEQSPEEVQKYLEEMDKIEEEVEKINAEAADAILEAEREANEKRIPAYKKRNEICNQIPGFWPTTFSKYSFINSLLSEEDHLILSHLKNFWVESVEGYKGFKVSFFFDPNPFFEDEVIFKEVVYNDEQQLVSSNSPPIKWKPGKGPNQSTQAGKRKEAPTTESFFTWFQMDDTELAETLKDDFWPNVIKVYQGLHGENFAEDDEEGEEGEEGEGEGEGEGEEDNE